MVFEGDSLKDYKLDFKDGKLVKVELPSVKECKEEKWIPVSERLPNDLEPVNITLVNHEPKVYYHDIKDKPFTATGVYFNGQWYWWSATCTDILAEYSHNYDNIIDNAIEVTAWQPLPKPYEEKRGNEEWIKERKE